MNAVKMTVRQVRAILKVAANKDVRFYLNGIHLDAETNSVVATNGHMLVVARPYNCTIGKSAIIPRDALERASKGAKPDDEILITDKIEVVRGEEAISIVPFTPIDDRYPEVTKVIPRQLSGGVAQINIEYLDALQTVLQSFSPNNRGMAEVHHNGATNAALVTLSSVQNAFGVVMPFRGSELNCELYDYFTSPREKAA